LGRPSDRFADVAGIVHGGGGRARRSGEEFTKALAKDRAKRSHLLTPDPSSPSSTRTNRTTMPVWQPSTDSTGPW
jgi:hypothetical protein